MLNAKIKELLNNIAPTFYQSTKSDHDKYIVFSIYDEQDTSFCDDENTEEIYYITLNYWYTKPSDLKLYKKIKQTLKSNDFITDGISDAKDGDLKGKRMDFIYYKNVEDEGEI
ncbi:hypothetical protein [Clostridium perfringens]|uniref:hypothetical protein n=1 Tax=Clostridium perfringens TaxID=1502 RepID=UPI002330792C|nr:hypothetical protein [Clostridium perfringens]MDB2049342.1 hypothetical protein [Clostridium perfringens]